MSIQLIIKDEVNIQITGLPVEVRRKLSNTFKYFDKSAQYRPAFKLGRWDGMVNLFSVGGNGYISQLERILEILASMKVSIDDIIDQRTPIDLTFDNITETYWADQCKVWPVGHSLEGQPIMLRDYQVNIIKHLTENTQCLASAATGCGKTIITATLSQLCEKFGRTITIVPNKSLVEQTEEDFINCGLDVGVYYGDRKNLSNKHTICTWQSLNILDKKSKNNEQDIITLTEFLADVKTVIVDECFSGDSLVLTPSGYVAIKDIKEGDLVINYSEDTKTFKTDTVVKQHINLTKASNETMYELVFDNEKIIKVTGNHKFLTTDGWARADSLTDEDIMVSRNGVIMLEKCKKIEKPEQVYNLHIENDHNYIVEGMVVANCHMAKAEVLKTLLTQNLKNAPIRWGLTGTVPKEAFEFESIYASIGPVISTLAASDLQDAGVLSSCHVNIMQLMDLPSFRTYADELNYLVTDENRMRYISNMILEISKTGNTLVLVNRIDSGKAIVKELPDAVFLSGANKTKDRKAEYDEIKVTNDKILVCTYGISSTGLNILRINNLVLLEPGKSFTRVIQSIGRGLRKGLDKESVEIYDISSTCKFSKRHLTTRKQFYTDAKYPFSIKKIDWKK